MCATPDDAAAGADAVLLCTPWPEFRAVDLAAVAGAMRGDLLLDGRNQLDPEAAAAAGLRYEGVGRGRHRLPEPPPRPGAGPLAPRPALSTPEP